jgi:hypothetical protein
LSHQRCDSITAEPSSSRTTFAAEASWPRRGRSRCTCGRKLVLEPCEREGAGDVGDLRETPGPDEAERADRGHELRAVDQRQALLRLELERLQPGARERLRPGEALALHPRLSLADEGQREVRERSEVAARADGAAARDVRQDTLVQAAEQELDRLYARARVALGERVRAEQHRRAHDFVRVGLADAARVAAQQAELELARQLGRDRLGDEAAEAGVDAVRVLALAVRRARDERAGSPHPRARRLGQLRARPLDRDRPHVLDGQVLAGQLTRGEHLRRV